MYCYDSTGPYCIYCEPNEDTYDRSCDVYGLPRYQCTNPLEYDNPIDPNEVSDCPDKYIREERKNASKEKRRILVHGQQKI